MAVDAIKEVIGKKRFKMNLFDYVYPHIYSWYYQMKLNGRKVNPQSLTSLAFSICSVGWLIFLIELYDRFFNEHHTTNVNTIVVIIVALLSGGLVNKIYSKNDRYLKIYNKYSASDKNSNKKRSTFLSWIFIWIPYLLFVLFWF